MGRSILGASNDSRTNVLARILDAHQTVRLAIDASHNRPGETLSRPELGLRIRQFLNLIAGHPCREIGTSDGQRIGRRQRWLMINERTLSWGECGEKHGSERANTEALGEV